MEVDVLIFGGGCAGLWLLDELRRRGFHAMLIEAKALGAGQTIASQGILHGGLKYSLAGALTSSARGVRDMPARWRAALAGGEPDLRGVRVLSPCCYMWRTEGLTSRAGLTAARVALRTAVEGVEASARPAALKACPGEVFRVEEQVIDVGSFLAELSRRHEGRVLRAGSEEIAFSLRADGQVAAVELKAPAGEREGVREIAAGRDYTMAHEPEIRHTGNGEALGASHASGPADISPPPQSGGAPGDAYSGQGAGKDSRGEGVRERILAPADGASRCTLQPRVVVFAAGAGNEHLRARVGLPTGAMQRRPLHMVMARGNLPIVYGHCVDGMHTRATITTHFEPGGGPVWQIGGEVAERGVKMHARELIAFAKKEIAAILPRIDLRGVQWAAYKIDRAEGRTATGQRPEAATMVREGNVITAWPTKLVLAPQLAEMVVEQLGAPRDAQTPKSQKVGGDELSAFLEWERPAVAKPPWEEVREWWS